MDAALFVLLPKNAVLDCVATQVFGTDVLWRFEDVELRRSDISDWAWQMLPPDRKAKKYDSYIVDDRSLMNLEATVNDCLPAEDAALAGWLLRTLVQANAWVMAFLWQWEEISTVCQATPEEAVDRLREVLKWDTVNKGFLVYGP
jgi:hypothetical protein